MMKLGPRNLALSIPFPCAKVSRDVMATILGFFGKPPFQWAYKLPPDAEKAAILARLSNSSVISFGLGLPRRMEKLTETPTP